MLVSLLLGAGKALAALATVGGLGYVWREIKKRRDAAKAAAQLPPGVVAEQQQAEVVDIDEVRREAAREAMREAKQAAEKIIAEQAEELRQAGIKEALKKIREDFFTAASSPSPHEALVEWFLNYIGVAKAEAIHIFRQAMANKSIREAEAA